MNENLAIISESITYDDLFVSGSGFPIVNDAVTIVSGSGALVRGTVLGQITIGAATSAAKTGGNAANTGALTLDETTPILAGAKAGAYTARCITAATNGGIFRVVDPDGLVLGDVAVAATFANHIKFAIADGTQDFIVGEGFDITIAAGSGKYKPVNSANVDGSAVAECVLASDVDATNDAVAPVYLTGEFNGAALTFGGTDTTATHKAKLRDLSIFIKTVA